jgi:CheY-like chemotaxis protein
MPVMDGVSLYQRLIKKQPGVKMILMTKSSAKIDHQILNDLGIIDYLAKPFDPGQIALVLHSALENH